MTYFAKGVVLAILQYTKRLRRRRRGEYRNGDGDMDGVFPSQAY